MGVVADLFSFAREVLSLSDKVQDLEREMVEMNRDVRQIDRRLTRIEAFVELSRASRAGRVPPSLPQED